MNLDSIRIALCLAADPRPASPRTRAIIAKASARRNATPPSAIPSSSPSTHARRRARPWVAGLQRCAPARAVVISPDGDYTSRGKGPRAGVQGTAAAPDPLLERENGHPQDSLDREARKNCRASPPWLPGVCRSNGGVASDRRAASGSIRTWESQQARSLPARCSSTGCAAGWLHRHGPHARLLGRGVPRPGEARAPREGNCRSRARRDHPHPRELFCSPGAEARETGASGSNHRPCSGRIGKCEPLVRQENRPAAPDAIHEDLERTLKILVVPARRQATSDECPPRWVCAHPHRPSPPPCVLTGPCSKGELVVLASGFASVSRTLPRMQASSTANTTGVTMTSTAQMKPALSREVTSGSPRNGARL